jgi:hypothetical protein
MIRHVNENLVFFAFEGILSHVFIIKDIHLCSCVCVFVCVCEYRSSPRRNLYLGNKRVDSAMFLPKKIDMLVMRFEEVSVSSSECEIAID